MQEENSYNMHGKPFSRETRVDFKIELNNLISRWFMEFHVYIYII